MKHTIIIPSFVALTLAAIAAPAHAQRTGAELRAAVEEEAKAADDVSTLNGQLVPVGDVNRYRYSYKRHNVSTNPLGIILGSYGLSGSYALNERIALRGDINYYAPVGSSTRGVELGIGAPIYFRKMYSGLFLEPGVIFRAVGAEYADEKNVVVGPHALVGYHWYWDSGLNVSAAVGVGRNWNTSSDKQRYGEDEIFPSGYLRFGYAF
jgi:hypothetical protein